VGITVNLYATLRQAAGVKSVQIDVRQAGLALPDILEELVQHFPALRTHLFDSAGKFHEHIHLFVNRQDLARLPGGMQSVLRSGDVLDMFPPLSGGSLL